jgi:hypothetical protein
MKTSITRRKAITALAVMPASVAIPAVGVSVGGELADKIRTLIAYEQANAGLSDAASDRHWRTVVRPHYKTFPGVPARSAEDALEAFDYLIRGDLIEHGANGYEKVTQSLVKAIRDYLASQVV